MTSGARVEIRLAALQHNFKLLKATVPDSKVMVAVKANAYGHGLLPVCRALPQADAVAVARLSEAVTLREAGIDQEIVILGGIANREELAIAHAQRCTLVVHSEYQVALLEAAKNLPDRVWLKIDTGMNRLGIRPEDTAELASRLRACTGNLGLMTHFANADDVDDPTSSDQLQRFIDAADGYNGDVSVANSATLLGWQSQINAPGLLNNAGEHWIRPGISLYGVSPLAGKSAAELGLKPVMQFESSLIAVKPIGKGDRVGYGGHWRAEKDSVLGIVAAGYGDGYSRFLPSGTPLLVNGRRVPLAGVVSMDLCAVDLGSESRDSVGDRVTLWGEQLPVEEIAQHANTIAYSLLCGVTDRTLPVASP